MTEINDFGVDLHTIDKIVDQSESDFMSDLANEIFLNLNLHFTLEGKKNSEIDNKLVVNAMDSCFYAYKDFIDTVMLKNKSLYNNSLQLKNIYAQTLLGSFYKITHLSFLIRNQIELKPLDVLAMRKVLMDDFNIDSRKQFERSYVQHCNDFFDEFETINLSRYCIDDYVFIVYDSQKSVESIVLYVVDLILDRFCSSLKNYLNRYFNNDNVYSLHNKLRLEKFLITALNETIKERVTRCRKSFLWYTNKKYTVEFLNLGDLEKLKFEDLTLDFEKAERTLLGDEYMDLIDEIPIKLAALRNKKFGVAECYANIHVQLTNELLFIYSQSFVNKTKVHATKKHIEEMLQVSLALVRVFDQKLVRQVFMS